MSYLYNTNYDRDGLTEVLHRRILLAYQFGREDEARSLEKEAGYEGNFDVYHHIERNFLFARLFDVKSAESEARKHAESISRTGLLFRGPDKLLVDCLLEMGMSYLRKNDRINAQRYILEAGTIAERSDLKIGRAKVHYAQAQQQLHEGFPVKADEYLKKVLQIEIPLTEFSDKTISLWRNTILDRDYDEVMNEFKSKNVDVNRVVIVTP